MLASRAPGVCVYFKLCRISQRSRKGLLRALAHARASECLVLVMAGNKLLVTEQHLFVVLRSIAPHKSSTTAVDKIPEIAVCGRYAHRGWLQVLCTGLYSCVFPQIEGSKSQGKNMHTQIPVVPHLPQGHASAWRACGKHTDMTNCDVCGRCLV